MTITKTQCAGLYAYNVLLDTQFIAQYQEL